VKYCPSPTFPTKTMVKPWSRFTSVLALPDLPYQNHGQAVVKVCFRPCPSRPSLPESWSERYRIVIYRIINPIRLSITVLSLPFYHGLLYGNLRLRGYNPVTGSVETSFRGRGVPRVRLDTTIRDRDRGRGVGRCLLRHGCWWRENERASERERLAAVNNLIFLLEPVNT
jgi:hypothetical protein